MKDSEWTIEKALMTGAEMELESYSLYTKAQKVATYPGSIQLLRELAADEKRHRETFLKALSDPNSIELKNLDKEIPDLKITDNLVKVPLSPGADYAQILTFAAQREKTTHDFYVQLAQKFKGTKLSSIFNTLAKEELRHKYKLEVEYDDIILKEM